MAKFKRILCLALVLIAILAFCACHDDDDDESSSDVPSSSETPSESEAPSETPDEPPVEESTLKELEGANSELGDGYSVPFPDNYNPQ